MDAGLCPSTPRWLLGGWNSTPRCSCAQAYPHRPCIGPFSAQVASVLCLQPQEEPLEKAWEGPEGGQWLPGAVG